MSRSEYKAAAFTAKDLADRSLEYAGDEPAMADALASAAQVYATLALAAATMATADHHDNE